MFKCFFEQSSDVGRFRFGGKIDITDPCYNKDVRGRFTVASKTGDYKCRVSTTDDGRVVAAIIIKHVDLPDEHMNFKFGTELVGHIGVDAGLAGFFNEKPDYISNGTWGAVCNEMSIQEEQGARHFFNKDGFFAMSGYGDGCYEVYGHQCGCDTYDALCIVFVPPDDDECEDDEIGFI